MPTQTGTLTLTGNYTFTPAAPASNTRPSSSDGGEPQQNGGGDFLPLGSLIPIASHLQGADDLPESGQVSPEGFMRCDGAEIPAGNRLTGTVPDLNHGRFLRGANTSGVTGGSEGFTLAEENLPTHSHDMAHGHDGELSEAGNHYHRLDLNTIQPSGGHNHTTHQGVLAGSRTGYAVEWSYDKGNFSFSSGEHTHNLTIEPNEGQSGSTGSGEAKTHIPPYLDVIYLIKVN